MHVFVACLHKVRHIADALDASKLCLHETLKPVQTKLYLLTKIVVRISFERPCQLSISFRKFNANYQTSCFKLVILKYFACWPGQKCGTQEATFSCQGFATFRHAALWLVVWRCRYFMQVSIANFHLRYLRDADLHKILTTAYQS